jgi:signal transduction histidine kinase
VYRARTFAWVLVRDITDKVRLESIAEAVETMNNIGYVFSAVRHELGNPINSIKAALSVLRANLESYSPDTVADYLERIVSEVGRVENLLRSLRSFSLYERPDFQRVEMESFLGSFSQLVAEETEKRGIVLATEAEADCWALCDPRALQQVMLNLFANAADALDGRPEPELRIGATSGDGLVFLRVIDNGEGIPEEQAKDLFKPFYTSKENGTGLGLVISRKMLAKIGGTIAIDSNAGEGTMVTITLPQCEPAPS